MLIERAHGFLRRNAFEHGDGLRLKIRAKAQDRLRWKFRCMNRGKQLRCGGAHARFSQSHEACADQVDTVGFLPQRPMSASGDPGTDAMDAGYSGSDGRKPFRVCGSLCTISESPRSMFGEDASTQSGLHSRTKAALDCA